MKAKSPIFIKIPTKIAFFTITFLTTFHLSFAQEQDKLEIPLTIEKTQATENNLLPAPYVDGRRIKFTTYEEDFLRITLRQPSSNQRITVHDGLLIDGDHEIILDWSQFRPGLYIIEIHSSKYFVRKQIRLI